MLSNKASRQTYDSRLAVYRLSRLHGSGEAKENVQSVTKQFILLAKWNELSGTFQD
jgi:hypothetical protein